MLNVAFDKETHCNVLDVRHDDWKDPGNVAVTFEIGYTPYNALTNPARRLDGKKSVDPAKEGRSSGRWGEPVRGRRGLSIIGIRQITTRKCARSLGRSQQPDESKTPDRIYDLSEMEMSNDNAD